MPDSAESSTNHTGDEPNANDPANGSDTTATNPGTTTTPSTPTVDASALSIKAGKAIRCPVYSYADHQRTSETELIRPSKVVIVEGILIFQDPRLREMLDIKIFVETDADVRILRRALRDVRDRSRTLESVITQYLTTVKPM